VAFPWRCVGPISIYVLVLLFIYISIIPTYKLPSMLTHLILLILEKKRNDRKKHYNLSITQISNFFLPNVVLHDESEGYFRLATSAETVRSKYMFLIHSISRKLFETSIYLRALFFSNRWASSKNRHKFLASRLSESRPTARYVRSVNENRRTLWIQAPRTRSFAISTPDLKKMAFSSSRTLDSFRNPRSRVRDVFERNIVRGVLL